MAVGCCVDVLVDASGRLGPLSYLAPDGLELPVGVGVMVPFGSRTSTGVVVGDGDPQRATRTVLSAGAARAYPAEVALARSLAERYFCDPAVLLGRLSPKSPKVARRRVFAAAALASPQPELADQLSAIPHARRYLLAEPAVRLPELAAHEALRLASFGQVLVLCPTNQVVDDVTALFSAGAAKLSSTKSHGAWRAFVDGELQVGVGTRTAALFSARRLAAIVVVDDQHPGHREASLPYTHARDLAVARASASKLRLSILSHSPNASGMRGQRCHIVKGGWPEMVLTDTSGLPPAQRWLPAPALKRSKLPSVVLAPQAQSWRCERCQTRAELSSAQPLARQMTAAACARCGGDRFYRCRLDADYATAAFKGAASPITWPELRELGSPCNVVAGDLDVYASVASLTPEADLARRVLSAAAAAGAGGRLVAWHRQSSKTLDLIFRQDLLTLAKLVWSQAKVNQVPPFAALVEIFTTGASAPVVTAWPGQVNGPRRTRDGEWQMLVTLPQEDVGLLADHVSRLRRTRKVRLTVQY